MGNEEQIQRMSFSRICLIGLFYLVSNFELSASTLEVGLIGRYTFENGNGEDFSGNGNTASILNASVAQGRFLNNNSYLCNADTKISVNLASQNISTVSIWFKVGSINHAYLTLFEHDSSGFSYFTVQGNHPSYLSAGTSGYGYSGSGFLTSSSLADNNWHQLITTYDAENQKQNIYLNGTFIGQGTATFNLNPASLFTMGSSIYVSDNGPAGFSGLIDDVRVYSRSLSSSEISTLYATESVPEPSALSLLAFGLGGLAMMRRRRS